MRSAKKEEQTNGIVTILSILVSSMIVYAIVFTSIGEHTQNTLQVVNVGLEGIMVMGAFSGIIFNLTFGPALGSLTAVVLDACCRDWSALLLDSRGGNHSFPC